MDKMYLLAVLLFVSVQTPIAQDKLPMIKATSTSIKILDGDDLQEGGLVPALRPDIYVYHKARKTKQIIFYTDIDSISFTVKQGDTYSFKVLLNDTDTCYQVLTFEHPNKVRYLKRFNGTSGNDTIAFSLGPNNAIHIKGSLNNSAILDLIFDTGANMGVLSEEGSKKNAALNKDNKNKFDFAGVTIENSPAIFVNYSGGLKADGVIGYNAFEEKILEINYDRKILVVHNSMEDVSRSYSANDMIWKGENLFIECVLQINNERRKGLFLFDTGSRWALSLTKDFATRNRLYDIMSKVGTRQAKGVSGRSVKSNTVTLPKLVIGNLSLENVPIDLELPSEGDGLDKNILGNDVLKRFNVVLDYKSGIIYLQPNSLRNAQYNRSFDEKVLFLAVGILLGLSVIGFIAYSRRKASRRK